MILDSIERGHVLDAMGLLDAGEDSGFADSIKYDVLHDGKRCPHKAVVGLASEFATGKRLTPDDFKGGEKSKCFKVLRSLGFDVVPKSTFLQSKSLLEFKHRQVYIRKSIHDKYGGQRQGGIATPKGWPAIFLFTGKVGRQYGYHDGWKGDPF